MLYCLLLYLTSLFYCRLEFSNKDMAYRMFGIVDPASSYTPLVAKMAAGSSIVYNLYIIVNVMFSS